MICCDKCKETMDATRSLVYFNESNDEIGIDRDALRKRFDLCQSCRTELEEALTSTLKKFLGE